MAVAKKAVVESKYCVACGNCVKVCPKKAIHIDRGTVAVVDKAACVGCGKCVKACPAYLIHMEELSHHG